MAENKKLLDLPNETLVKICSYLDKNNLFWNVGLVCLRLMNITFTVNRTIVIPCQGNHKHPISITEQDETKENQALQRIKMVFQYKEIAQCVTSFHMKDMILVAQNTSGVTVRYNGPAVRPMHSVAMIIKIEKLEGVHLNFVLDTTSQDIIEDDIYTIQTIANRFPNVRKLAISYYARHYFLSETLGADRAFNRKRARSELRKHVTSLKKMICLSMECDDYCNPSEFNKSLYSIMLHCNGLEELYLRPYLVPVLYLSCKCLNLKFLQVDCCLSLYDDGLAAILQVCPNLCELHLIGLLPSYSSNLSPVGLKKIKKCVSLHRLSLMLTNYKHGFLINEAIETILSKCQKLEYLRVSNAYDLSRFEYKYIEWLGLEGNAGDKKDKSVEVSNQYYKTQPTIKSLNIGHGTDVYWISKILKTFTNLELLTVCSCNTKYRKSTILAIKDAIRKERNLITLTMEGCPKSKVLTPPTSPGLIGSAEWFFLD